MELVIVCAERDEGPYRGNGLLSDLIKEFSTSELRALPVSLQAVAAELTGYAGKFRCFLETRV
jgi:hypothetical protein